MTNGSQGFNRLFGTNAIYYQQNAFDLGAEYGPSPLDATHNFSSVVVYELPFGRRRHFGANINRAADLLLGGWKLSGLVSYFTGNPVTITSPNNYGGQLHDVGSDRANHLNTLNIRTAPSITGLAQVPLRHRASRSPMAPLRAMPIPARTPPSRIPASARQPTGHSADLASRT